MSDQTAAPEATDAVEAPAVTLSLTDIQNAVKVIDFAAEQGAFKGWKTIEQVLVVRERLNAFLLAAAPQQTEEAEATDAPAADAQG